MKYLRQLFSYKKHVLTWCTKYFKLFKKKKVISETIFRFPKVKENNTVELPQDL